MIRKFFTTLTILTAAIVLTGSVNGQSKKGGMNARFFDLVQAAKNGKAKLNPEIAQQVRDDFSEERAGGSESPIPSIVGSWNCKIATSDGGLAPFEALHTFGTDGTFVETSSLLGMGGEGPAHGVYERAKRGYVLTFELFVFDPGTGESVGRVRVRSSIRMTSSNDFTALTAVDFIEPDGTVIGDIDGGPFRAERLHVRGY